MASYKGHLIGGFISFCLLIFVGNFVMSCHQAAICLLLTLFGSLFPDIDIKSKGQKYTYALLFLLVAILIIKKFLMAASLLGLFSLIPLLVRHRGIFHDPLFLALLVLFVFILLDYCFEKQVNMLCYGSLFFFTGTISHLVMDFGLYQCLKKIFK